LRVFSFPQKCTPTHQLIRVFTGGRDGCQYDPFLDSYRRLQVKTGVTVTVEMMNNDDIKKKHWTPYEAVEWLHFSDIHFWLTHPHQGMPGWHVLDIQRALTLLQGHRGFPSGHKLRCPIFLQDKYLYLSRISDFVNPTFKYNFPFEALKLVLEVSEFCANNNEGIGWVVKLPYTTNSHAIKFCPTVEKLFHALYCLWIRYGHLIHYAMIQARMRNRKEYKIVIFNGKVQYIANISTGRRIKGCVHFSYPPHSALFEFAEMIVSHLSTTCPSFISDGLVRVDVFQTMHNRFVVNEIESLEANYSATFPIDQFTLRTKLNGYWHSKLFELIS
jgi:hypothetical protein